MTVSGRGPDTCGSCDGPADASPPGHGVGVGLSGLLFEAAVEGSRVHSHQEVHLAVAQRLDQVKVGQVLPSPLKAGPIGGLQVAHRR